MTCLDMFPCDNEPQNTIYTVCFIIEQPVITNNIILGIGTLEFGI